MAKSRLFTRIARAYVRRKLGRTFSDVRLKGFEGLQLLLERQSFILACNHVAYWDPLVLVLLDDALDADGHCLMDADNLEKLPFFAWLGALPIARNQPVKAYRDITEARLVLRKPRSILAIFPQGEQRPAHHPLTFKPGIGALAALSNAPVVPLAIRYDYEDGPRPVIHLVAGHPMRFDGTSEGRDTFLNDLATQVSRALAEIDQFLLQPVSQRVESSGFTSLLGRPLGGNTSLELPAGTLALRLLSAPRRTAAAIEGKGGK